MADYTDLKAWQLSKDLVVEVYRCTAQFPKEELYGLTSQMRRAAVSIPSNIAEGKGRYSTKELVQSLFRARGSLLELETQIVIAKELGFMDTRVFSRLKGKSRELGQILNGLISRFQQLSKV